VNETTFWLSWYVKDEAFELHSPWWVSGYRCEEDGDTPTVCAAVRATSEDGAKAKIVAAHDDKSVQIEWRFCSDKGPDYNPFNDRFERADWMVWP
jgi:hypothetical protein